MAAGQGYIEFATGDVLTAAAANGYLASQVVMVFASSAARTSAIASPQEGMVSYLKDTNALEAYDGSAWVAVGGSSGSTFAGCRLYKDAGQTIADATQTAVTFNQETYDTNTYHDNSTNTSRITIPATKAGYYLFVCKWSLGENPTGYRQVELRKNNSAMDRTSIRGTSSGQNFVILSTVQSAAVDDYFEFFVYQTSGENLGVEAGTLQTVFTAAYLGA
jgi:hypothetical protein